MKLIKNLFLNCLWSLLILGCNNPAGNSGEKLLEVDQTYGSVQVQELYDRPIASLFGEYSDLSSQTQEFALTLFSYIQDEKPIENFTLSPISLSIAMAMVMNGSNGDMTDSILNGLGYGRLGMKSVNAYIPKLIGDISERQDVTLNISNAIWMDRSYLPLKRSFYEVLSKHYLASVYPLTTSGEINQWVNDKTQGKIPKIMSDLLPGLVMVLSNAVYFKGIWATPFSASQTAEGEFQTPAGKVNVEYMKADLVLPYKRGADYRAVSLPYEDKKMSFFIFLPDSGKTLADIPIRSNAELFKGFEAYEVNLSMPKFKMEHTITFSKKGGSQAFSKIGLGLIFDESLSGFSNFCEGKNLTINEVIHKSIVEVNEEGTEAAAATVVTLVDTAAVMPGADFHTSRPFAFCVRDEPTKTILFIGQMQNPLASKE